MKCGLYVIVHLEPRVQVRVIEVVSDRGGLMMFCDCDVKLADAYDLGGR